MGTMNWRAGTLMEILPANSTVRLSLLLRYLQSQRPWELT